jgi:AraC-like DNA-binding protein
VFLQSPEFQEIKALFERSKQGVSFHGKIRKEVAALMLRLPTLQGFERLLLLLRILQKLAITAEFTVLKINGSAYESAHREEARIRKIYTHVEQHYQQEIDLQKVADLVNLTVPSFCRYFKKMMRMTFTDFVNEYRINQACKTLNQGQSVSDACYENGFNNLSHFTKTFKSIIGKTPREYRKEL